MVQVWSLHLDLSPLFLFVIGPHHAPYSVFWCFYWNLHLTWFLFAVVATKFYKVDELHQIGEIKLVHDSVAEGSHDFEE